VAAAVVAARHRDVHGSLAAARRWRQRGSETARRSVGAAAAAASAVVTAALLRDVGGSLAAARWRWQQRWRQRNSAMVAAAWQRRGGGVAPGVMGRRSFTDSHLKDLHAVFIQNEMVPLA
jgi:hypothetical protein